MPPAARITDMHTCPMFNGPVPHVGGPVIVGCPTVLTGMLPQARVGDNLVCVGPPDVIVKGSAGVFVGGPPAARMGDMTAHGGVIVLGCPTVIIGETASVPAGGTGVPITPRMGVEGGAANQAASAAVMIDASKSGAPFCEQCAKGQ